MSFLHYPDPQRVFHQVSRVLALGSRFYLVDGYRGEDDFSSSVPWIGEMRLYNRQQREQLGREAGLSAIAHHYLMPGILLTILATSVEQGI